MRLVLLVLLTLVAVSVSGCASTAPRDAALRLEAPGPTEVNAHALWVPGHWRKVDRGYVWIEGHWT